MAYPYTSYQNPYQQGYYPYQMMQQPIQQMPQQPVQQTQPQQNTPMYSSGMIWVNGKAEADFYPLAPNNAVALWDRSGKQIFLKSADATGKPSMKIYDLVERAETDSNGVSDADGKLPAYATKDELSAVVGVVKGFDELIGSLKSDIDNMKGDLYGIAGKKKPKKAEVAEDE